MSENNGLNTQHISRYGNGGFTISQTEYRGSVAIIGNQSTAWHVKSAIEISLETLSPFLGQSDLIDILLIGCGDMASFISPEIKTTFKQQGINIDAMDTGAACRTYNILMSESRRVAAALIAQ